MLNDKGAYVAIQLTVDLKPNLPRKLVIYIPAQILERVHIMKFFLNSLVKVCYVNKVDCIYQSPKRMLTEAEVASATSMLP